jgi:hypothetical protein
MSYTTTASDTYSVVDIENVVRNFAADLRMIAESSNTWDRETVENYISDIIYFAKNRYLLYVDVTLLSGLSVELKAARYTVNEKSGELTASRPGGVMWPRVSGTTLRIVVGKNSKWESDPPDIRLRLYPAALAKAFPNSKLQIEHLLESAAEIEPSPIIEDA